MKTAVSKLLESTGVGHKGVLLLVSKVGRSKQSLKQIVYHLSSDDFRGACDRSRDYLETTNQKASIRPAIAHVNSVHGLHKTSADHCQQLKIQGPISLSQATGDEGKGLRTTKKMPDSFSILATQICIVPMYLKPSTTVINSIEGETAFSELLGRRGKTTDALIQISGATQDKIWKNPRAVRTLRPNALLGPFRPESYAACTAPPDRD